MKKLNKVTINSKKTMRNEELLTLRGGYGALDCCACSDRNRNFYGFMITSKANCESDCKLVTYTGTWIC